MHLDSVLLGRHISVGGPLAQCKRHMVFARVNLNRLVSQRNLSANVNKHSLAQCVCFEAKAKQPDWLWCFVSKTFPFIGCDVEARPERTCSRLNVFVTRGPRSGSATQQVPAVVSLLMRNFEAERHQRRRSGGPGMLTPSQPDLCVPPCHCASLRHRRVQTSPSREPLGPFVMNKQTLGLDNVGIKKNKDLAPQYFVLLVQTDWLFISVAVWRWCDGAGVFDTNAAAHSTFVSAYTLFIMRVPVYAQPWGLLLRCLWICSHICLWCDVWLLLLSLTVFCFY